MTGKPLEMGGIQGRTEATGSVACTSVTLIWAGLGVFFGIREACRNVEMMERAGLSLGIPDKTVVIQGFGNG